MYQGLNDKNCYLPVEIVTQKRTLCSNNSGPCVDQGEIYTNIRSNESKIIFNSQARNFYKGKGFVAIKPLPMIF